MRYYNHFNQYKYTASDKNTTERITRLLVNIPSPNKYIE